MGYWNIPHYQVTCLASLHGRPFTDLQNSTLEHITRPITINDLVAGTRCPLSFISGELYYLIKRGFLHIAYPTPLERIAS
jgi:hypothetical protein